MASRCDGASATVDTAAATSRAARTRERRGAGTRLYSLLEPAAWCHRSGVGSCWGAHAATRKKGYPRANRALVVSSLVNAAMQVTDVNGIRRTVIQTPENRKVGGSTPPQVATATRVNDHARSFHFPR
jgi:hypothetical protein